jgi:hypothetical protein
MDDFITDYIQQAEKEFDRLKKEIDGLKLKFQLTRWTDLKLMFEAAGEIWSLESRFNDYTEQHKIILENYRSGE